MNRRSGAHLTPNASRPYVPLCAPVCPCAFSLPHRCCLMGVAGFLFCYAALLP